MHPLKPINLTSGVVTVRLATVEETIDLLSICQRANAFDMPEILESSHFFLNNLKNFRLAL